MNNPNPFLPQGSLLEQQSRRRSQLKIGVSCVLAVGVLGLVGMLIQGCERKKPADENPTPAVDTNAFALDTTTPPPVDTNAPANTPVVVPPVATNTPIVVPPTVVEPVVAAGTEYAVVKGDSLAKIAKKNGVTVKALQAANPTVVPTKLKIGQKLVIPAGGKTSAETAAPTTAAVGDTSSNTYTVKSGDSLTKIAKAHGTTVKAIETANGMTTTKLKVGQKIKVPSKAEAAAPVLATPPAEPMPATPVLSTPTAPAPAK